MIEIQVDQAIAALDELGKRQIPFAISMALNRTAEDGQAAVRERLGGEFTLRRKDYIDRTIKIENRDRATKTKPFVIVGVDPTRNVLAKFELGGAKTPVSGRALAVPIDARRNKSDIVTKSQRIRSLNLRKVGSKAGGIRIQGDKGTFVAGGAVLQRVGSRGKIRVLYAFKDSVPLRPVLRFEDTVTRTVEKRWAPNFEGSFAFAMRTSR